MSDISSLPLDRALKELKLLFSQNISQSELDRFIFFERKAGFADRFVRMRCAIQAGVKLRAPVFVYWPVNDACNGHFLSVFEEIENVTFVDEKRAALLRHHSGRVDDELVNENSTRRPISGEKFSMLKLRTEYIHVVKDFVGHFDIEGSIGFHIRTTDNEMRRKRRGIVFFYEVFDQVAENTKKKIFLATDNRAVRNEFVKNYGERIVLYGDDFDPKMLRQTPLKSAIIELFVLAHCSDFYGTVDTDGLTRSAFSRMARHLGQERRLNVLPGFESTDKS